jgi:hypothetical protein
VIPAITVAAAIFLFWIYSHSHSEAILTGVIICAAILAEGNWHFARVRKRARAQRARG